MFARVAVARPTFPALRRGRGRIVNIGSIGGRVGQPFVGAYCGSKGAVRLMSASLRQRAAAVGHLGGVRRARHDRDRDLGQGRESAEDLTEAMTAEDRPLRRRSGAMRRSSASRTQRPPPDDVAERVEHALYARRPGPTTCRARRAVPRHDAACAPRARAGPACWARLLGVADENP